MTDLPHLRGLVGGRARHHCGSSRRTIEDGTAPGNGYSLILFREALINAKMRSFDRLRLRRTFFLSKPVAHSGGRERVAWGTLPLVTPAGCTSPLMASTVPAASRNTVRAVYRSTCCRRQEKPFCSTTCHFIPRAVTADSISRAVTADLRDRAVRNLGPHVRFCGF